MSKIKIFGERNTGTNYLKELIFENLEVEFLKGLPSNTKYAGGNESVNLYFRLFGHENLGWKHSKVRMDWVLNHEALAEVYFICLAKNPYSYLLSLHRKAYHYVGKKPVDFLEFLQREWKSQERDNTENVLPSPIDLWNIKCGSYLRLRSNLPDQTWVINYEALLADPKKFIEDLKLKTNLPTKGDFTAIGHSTKNENKTYQDYLDYYKNEHWKSKLKLDQVQFINERIDRKLMDDLGYKMITSL